MKLLISLENNYLQADSMLALLKSCGINAHMQPADNNNITQVLLGQSIQSRFHFDIFVPENEFDEALAIINAPIEEFDDAE